MELVNQSYQLQEVNNILQDHSNKLQEVNNILQDHSNKLQEVNNILQDHSNKLQEHSTKLDQLQVLDMRIETAIKYDLTRLMHEEHNGRSFRQARPAPDHSDKLDQLQVLGKRTRDTMEDHSNKLQEHSTKLDQLQVLDMRIETAIKYDLTRLMHEEHNGISFKQARPAPETIKYLTRLTPCMKNTLKDIQRLMENAQPANQIEKIKEEIMQELKENLNQNVMHNIACMQKLESLPTSGDQVDDEAGHGAASR
ncbi:hypothetical protein GUITHDRAFT_144951 [Guillardia theta CCMP2712]|uniref:Uncharacterized protein n=1 Tax=Guillardia theta (strain CCMP2712) TaxID=905079 RepID=L1IN57_GUITC|nr:hypothetical protein GUITHDRAFT_144951 [Guillardia theta CCMP2712]EKX37527.1 hypothetical protein GUITHDRAFT_144951 [Guillardia theta CCMP2712]|eukprot:XP_005824507.1 hypothetical protein GUITHDRAFT_144951 [Guillardia theta CCMP2712]